MRRRDFIGLLGGVALAPRWRPRDEVFVERWSWAMGQAVHVMLFASSEDEGLEACAAALAELRRIEARLSRFDDASDLSELNRRAGGRPLRVDADLQAVLRHADACHRSTGGAFDVAVEPLMRVWGFHEARRAAPTARELAEARAAVSAAEVRLADGTAFLPSAHTQLDLGGIGVGYGIDRALAVLRARRIRRAFVDVSGDCGALGAPPGEPGWLVAVANTRQEWRLRDAALATSSNEVVRGHVLDPGTGAPASARRQATVVARTAVKADALSTAALVSRYVGGAAVIATLACAPDSGAPSLARAQEVGGAMLSAAVWQGGGRRTDSVALSHALDVAFDSVRSVDSLPTGSHPHAVPRRERGLEPDSAGLHDGLALDAAGDVLGAVADSALLSWSDHYLWISRGGHPTRRMVGVADPRHALRTAAAVELRAGSLRAVTEMTPARTVAVLAASGVAAGAWARPLWALGCDRALAAGVAPPGISVVCVDSVGVGWTDDLDGRVVLPTAPGTPPPARRPVPAPGPARGPRDSRTRSPAPGS